MSYLSYEQSDYSGHPIELFKFSMGSSQWLYTSSSQEVSMLEDVYQPVYISRDSFTNSGDISQSTLNISVASTNPVALLFRSGWIPNTVILTIFRHHFNDSDFVTIWKGRITSCKWAGSVATLTSDTVFTLMRRAGLRRVYQISCPHSLYGPLCRVQESDFEVATTVTSVATNVVTISGLSGYGDGYFTGGKIRNLSDVMMIMNHTGDNLTLVDAVESMVAFLPVSLYPGCSRNVTDCINKFNNLDNYGGLPFLPYTNPFTGDALV